MRKAADLPTSISPKTALLIGGCYGSAFHLSDSGDENARACQSQIMLANCIVMTFCLSIIALVVAIAWT